MDTLTHSSIDALAARTTVKDYGNISVVTIPGCSKLSESERAAVFSRAQQRHMATPIDADTLMSRLRYITPPLDEDEENEESRLLEARARKELDDDGCPPCYLSYLDIPLQNHPEEYQAIIQYWQSFPGTDNVVLCAQLSDWKLFRAAQLTVRLRCRNKRFSHFVDEVRERRRRHKLDGDVCLLFDAKQQSLLENWTEYQNFHLKRFERLGMKRDELKELDEARQKAADTNIEGLRSAEDAEAVEQNLKNAERDLERHEVLLQWIEQKRQVMGTGYPTPVEEGNDDQDAAPKAVRRTSTRDRRTRRPEATVLGKIRVSKAKPKNQKTDRQVQKYKAVQFEPAIQSPEATPQGTAPPAWKGVGPRPRSA